ncbi:uncharacterized protein LOC131953618 [Physella acuta]|uniref:uncharacterized protein LOC131953618 n=1 Tax=Physella acuta TaxID=109671 RepID=UPI0027DC2E4B|nr:uncharacterized protein LOC131953618 [Physella acuta]
MASSRKGRLKLEDEAVLQENLVYLIKEVDALDIVDVLFAKNVFTLDDKHVISGMPTATGRMRTLLDKLFHAGSGPAFGHFLEALDENYSHVSARLRQGASADSRASRHLTNDHIKNSSSTTNNRPHTNTTKDEPSYKLKLEALEEEKNQLLERIKELETCQAQRHVEVSVPVGKLQHALMLGCFGSFDDCRVSYNRLTKLATIRGKEADVSNQIRKIVTEVKRIKTAKIFLTELMLQLLSTQKAWCVLGDLTHLGQVKYMLKTHYLLLASNDDVVLHRAMTHLLRILNHKVVARSTEAILIDTLTSLKDHLEKDLLVRVTWNVEKTEIYLEGLEEDVLISRRQTQTLIGDHLEYETTHHMLQCTYLQKFHQSALFKLFRETEETNPLCCRPDTAVVSFHTFMHLADDVITRTWNLHTLCGQLMTDVILVIRGFQDELIQENISEFQSKEKCVVTSNVSDFLRDEDVKPDDKDVKPVDDAVKPDDKDFKFVRNQAGLAHSSSLFKDFNTVKIKCGCIDEENTDVIVYQWNDAACPSVSADVVKMCQAERQKNPKAIIFILAKQLSTDFSYVTCTRLGSNSRSDLVTVYKTILDKVLELGATSVAVPALTFTELPVDDVILIARRTINRYITLRPIDVHIVIDDKDTFLKLNVPTANDVSLEEKGCEYEIVPVLNIDPRILPEVSITADKNTDLDSVMVRLCGQIFHKCLYTSEVSSSAINFWPDGLHNMLVERCKSLTVCLKLVSDQTTITCKLKGLQKDVELIKSLIDAEVQKVSDALQKHAIATYKTHQRHRVTFLKYASGVDEICPSYWTLFNDKTFWRGVVNHPDQAVDLKSRQSYLIDVDDVTRQAVSDLVLKTWDLNHAGEGRDAAGLEDNTGIHIVNVQRYESLQTFQRYSHSRKSLFSKMSESGKLCCDLSKILPGHQIKTTKLLGSVLSQELYSEINEHFLFFGIKPGLADALRTGSLSPLFSTSGILGRALYFAEESTKSNQHTDLTPTRKEPTVCRQPPGTELYLCLVRVLLGNPYVIDKKHRRVTSGGDRFTGPPCVKCEDETCTKNHPMYDSIILDDDGLMFRKFVIYNENCCYPEYLITYRREVFV